MAELSLDDVEQDALAGEFDSVRVAELVRREAPPRTPAWTARRRSSVRTPARRPRPAAGQPVDDAEQPSDR